MKVLSSSEVVEPAKSAKKIVKKKPDSKPKKKASTEGNSDNSDEVSEEEENEEDEVKPRRKGVPKGKTQTSVGRKKRKGDETNLPSKKKAKPDKQPQKSIAMQKMMKKTPKTMIKTPKMISPIHQQRILPRLYLIIHYYVLTADCMWKYLGL